MAGVNYEVNIQLNAKTLDKQLGDLEKRVNNLKKNLAAPLRNEDAAARRSLTTQKQSARLAERRQATQIVTYNLGRKTNELEARGVNVAKIREKLSTAARENDKGRLTMARAQNSVARTLIAQETAKLRISTKANRMQAESIDALFKAQVKRYTLDQQIRRLEEDGVKTDKLRAKLGEVTTAQARRQFGSFKQLTGELSLAIRKERDKLALQKRQTRELERQRKLGMGTGATSPLGGTPQMVGSPAYKTRQLNLNANWTKFLGDLNDTAQIINATRANNVRVNQFKKAQINRNWGLFLDQLNETSRVIQQSAQAGQRKKRNERLQGVALGAGFPLLFGGGPGAVLGGAAGGLVGGPAGFAAQIALSALGQQLDKFATATFETGKAFTSTSGALDLMSEKALFSSDAAMEHAIALEEQGKATELAQFLANDMAKAIGNNGVQALKDLGDESKETTKQWNLLTIQLQRLVAGPLSGFLKILNQVLGQITTGAAFKGFMQDISPEAQARAQARLIELTGTEQQRRQMARTGRKIPGLMGTTAAQQQIMREMAGERPAAPAFDVTGADLRSITAPKAKKGRRSRIPDLQAEQQKLQQLLGLERTMFELKRNDDDLGVRQLEHRMRMAELAEKEAKIRASDVPQKEKDLAISNLGLEAKRAELQLAYDIEQINKEAAQRAFEEMQNKIKQQNQLNKGMQQQLQLAQQVSDVLGQGMTRSFDLLITGANNWGMALRDIAANVLQDIARQLIQIYVIEQAVGFMRNLMSPTSSLTAPGGRYEGQAGALAPKPPPLPPLPGKALGGAVSAGKPYMVGERGPEMFVPGAQGNIVPTSGMGGSNIVVNVDATGSSVEGNAEDSKRLGEAIGVAIRQELIKQKRPGGLLA